MNILAIDTSTDYLTLAMMKNGKVVARFHRKVGRNHSTLLVPMIDRLLKKCRTGLKSIDVFAIGVGPGSFTGLRIGVTTVKGLAYALAKPVVAVPTFDAIALNGVKHRGTICVVMDARKNKVYACIYSSDGKAVKRISKYLLVPAGELVEKLKKYGKITFLGDGVSLIGQIPEIKNWYPKAEMIARLGIEQFMKKKVVKAADLEPFYIYSRECDITGQ